MLIKIRDLGLPLLSLARREAARERARLGREEIVAVYAAGPEAVVALVETLLDEQAELGQQIQALTARVQGLIFAAGGGRLT